LLAANRNTSRNIFPPAVMPANRSRVFTPPELKVIIPEDRVALRPAPVRSHSRLLVLNRGSGRIAHLGRFEDVAEFLRGDLLVVNDTRVLPARATGRKPGGARWSCCFFPARKGGPPARPRRC